MQRINILLMLATLCQIASCSSPSKLTDRINAKTPVKGFYNLDDAKLAGVYSRPGPSYVARKGPGLGGNGLFLFPDDTYLYLVATDVGSIQILDKGTWHYSRGTIELVSDPEVKWDPEIERRFITIHRLAMEREVLLIGTDLDLSHFEKESAVDSETTLLGFAHERFKAINPSEATELKANLLKNYWFPKR